VPTTLLAAMAMLVAPLTAAARAGGVVSDFVVSAQFSSNMTPLEFSVWHFRKRDSAGSTCTRHRHAIRLRSSQCPAPFPLPHV